MSAKHTPGPWHIDRQFALTDNEHSIRDAADRFVGRFSATIEADDCGRADARLIAAAPELLALARAVSERFAAADAPLGNIARATIAKAEGRP